MSTTPLTIQIDRTVTPSPVYIYGKTADPSTAVRIGSLDADDNWIPSGPGMDLTDVLAALATQSEDIANLWSFLQKCRFNGQQLPVVHTSIDDVGLGAFQELTVAFLSFDFTQGILPPNAGNAVSTVTATGGANGTRVDNTGTLVAASAPRFDYSPVSPYPALGILNEPTSTNLLRNNTATGAVAGTPASGGGPGTPGTPPTNSSASGAGLTANIVGTGTIAGVPYFDVQFYGTATSTTAIVYFETATAIAVPTSTVSNFALGVTVSVVAGDLTNVSSHRLVLNEGTSAGAVVSANIGNSTMAAPTATPTRFTNTFSTSGGATVATVRPYFRASFASGAVINVTYRISLPQLETGALATSPILTTNATVTRSAEQISFQVPDGIRQLGITFDDASTQSINVNPGAGFVVPKGSLQRQRITTIKGQLTILNRPGA